MNLKKCIYCDELKKIEDFVKKENCCKQCKNNYKKEYYKLNKEKIAVYKKKHYKSNKEEINNKNKEYYKTNKQKISIQRRMYRENNLEEILLRKAKYRAKKDNLNFTITLNDVKNAMSDICPLLEIKMNINKNTVKDDSFTLDKILPEKGYVEGNIIVISHKANRSKSNATIEEYKNVINGLKNITKNGINFEVDCKYINKFVRETLDHAKKRSKKYNLLFDIDSKYLKGIYPKNNKCPLLGIELKRGDSKCQFSSPTLDRIIPENGYVKGNVLFISHKANTIKNNLTLDEMSMLIRNLEKLKR